ncbi:TolC family protein [Echinicola strongylocentroti]|uniref:TolC family protein n=1 Tax=Echinicola strongylocentroti TaxID=1795355 RepID=A0A2Z4IEW4_9BACT|nr:TolC family protein [Echinicola strongylocentroti]AWW29631.1 TolC family protein [Echinicola strongylocentroti]
MIREGIYTILLFVVLGGLLPKATAQDTGDNALEFDQYMQHVLDYHPLSRKARLNAQKADATVRAARGNFDPVVGADFSQKHYDDKIYYRKLASGLRIPTVAGFDLVAGYEKNSGNYLNPESNTAGNDGLWNAGIELNVLQGLLMDEGRTALRQAKAYAAIAENEQVLQTNDLYFSAAEAYFYWANSHQSLIIVKESVVLAENYFENTRTAYENGEKTAMDTLEAYTVWQDRKNLLQTAESSYVSTMTNLENFLWDENGNAFLEGRKPEQLETIHEEVPVPMIPVDSVEQHPMLQKARLNLTALEAERRMKQEKLLPKLKVKYMPLLTPDGEGLPGYNQNDYKWGFSFSFPLLLRGERGNLQLSKIKLQQKQLELDNKTLGLKNKVINSIAQIDLLENQVSNQQQNVAGYERLLWAESEKFNYGESSVFLLNKRQEKYLEGQLKLVDLITKWQLEKLKYGYFSNTLDIPEGEE